MAVSAAESIGHVTGLRSGEDTRSLPTDSSIFRVARVDVESCRPASLLGWPRADMYVRAVFRDSFFTSRYAMKRIMDELGIGKEG